MLQRKLIQTLVAVAVVVAAANLIDYLYCTLVTGTPDDYLWVTTTTVSLLVGLPVAFFLIGQRIDIQATREALLRARDEARAANQAKSDFLANMSHEIRTPLNGVLGMVHAMGQNALSPDQSERLGVIRQSGETLVTLLNDILDFSKIEAGKLELEAVEFDLGELINSAGSTFAVMATTKDIDPQIDIHQGYRSADRYR